MTWFLLYLFVTVEKIAAFLAIGGTIFFWSIVIFVATTILNAAFSKNAEEYNTNRANSKWLKRLMICTALLGAMMFSASQLMPSKKELAVIVVGGGVYEALTSETAKEIGGDALKLLRQELSGALQTAPALGAEVVKEGINQGKEAIRKELNDVKSS